MEDTIKIFFAPRHCTPYVCTGCDKLCNEDLWRMFGTARILIEKHYKIKLSSQPLYFCILCKEFVIALVNRIIPDIHHDEAEMWKNRFEAELESETPCNVE